MPASSPDFTEATRRLLFENVNGRCCLCDAYTSAASPSTPKLSVKIGDAAHICDARPGGSRYVASMTDDQRSDATNGLWLCASCHRRIDSNGGRNFSIAQLRESKAQAEQKARDRLGLREEITRVSGSYSVEGIGEVTALDVGPENIVIEPGTTVSARGIGRITGMRIGR